MSIVAVISTHAQNNCYIQLDEASGFDVTPYQADLDARACELVAAFPDSTYADSFKVYSFGFYVNLAFYDTYSYPQAFSDMKEEVAGLSPYYLLIGRQSGPEGIFTKFWVDVKLPETGSFGCMDEYWRIALDFRIQNSIELSYTENGKTPNVYVEAEKVGMDSLASFVKQQASCCDPQNRSACNLCLSFLEKEAVLKSFGFSKIERGILQDESSMPAAQDVDDFSNSLVDVDGRLQEMIQYVQSKGHSSHGFITVDDCDFSIFSTAKQLFEADQSEYKIWWHLMKNPETGEFEVSEKISNYEEFLDEYIISLLGEDYWGTVLPGLECHETLRGFNIWIPDDWSTSPTDMIEGNIAHRIIASYYKEVSHAIDSVATEYLIPQSSSNGTGNVGYADIVNLTYGDIYEIKKYGLETQAATEALRYVEKANLFCPKPIVAPSYVLGGETTFPVFPFLYNKQLLAYWDGAGIIIYQIEDGYIPDPQYVPIPGFLPQNVFDKLKELMERLSQGVGNVEVFIAKFMKKNPELCEFIVNYAGGIIITVVTVNLIEDLITGGLGVWNDLFVFTSLYRIISIAKKVYPLL